MMRVGRLLAAVVTIVMWLGSAVVGVAAESFKIAVLDQQAIMEKTKAGKRALDELKSYSLTRQKIVDVDDQELKSLEQSLQDPSSKLSDVEKQEKQEVFRTKLEAYQKRIQAFNREVQEKQRAMIAEYSDKIRQAALTVAEKQGYAAVLEKGAETNIKIVIYHQPSVDVTEQVIKEFDRQNK